MYQEKPSRPLTLPLATRVHTRVAVHLRVMSTRVCTRASVASASRLPILKIPYANAIYRVSLESRETWLSIAAAPEFVISMHFVLETNEHREAFCLRNGFHI